MAKSKKWSEQTLSEKSFTTRDKNGKEVTTKKNVLEVCLGGLQLFKKEFMNSENALDVPFDFIVLAGPECPKGCFYEMEYQTRDGDGNVYHALFQLVNPVKDIRLVLACLKRRNILPEGFSPMKLWLADNIDCVFPCYCSKDESGPYISGGTKEEKADDDASIVSYIEDQDWGHSACLEYYRGEVREVWAKKEDIDNFPQVFVCGSDNVNDPVFAKQRDADIEEMMDCLDTAKQIACDYNLSYIIAVESIEDTKGKGTKHNVSISADETILDKFIGMLKEVKKALGGMKV